MINPIDSTTAAPSGRGAKKGVAYDLMRGGAGTPWENRGEYGTAGGFIKSAMRSVFKPDLLFNHIRSTTVTTEANTFLWICAACWGVATALYKAVAFYRYDASKYDIDTNTYVIISVIETAGAVAFAYAMLRLIILIYHKLVITEIKQPVPVTLTFNIAAYAMGASVFAIIPIVGPLLALAGCFVSLVAAGRKRLFVSWRGAVIDAMLAFVVAIVATILLFFIGGWALNYLLGAVNDHPAGPVLPAP
jgi:hypothetical protein